MTWRRVTSKIFVFSLLRSATDGQLVVPKTSKKAGDRAFAVAGPQARNKLPAYVRQSPSLETFKRTLKTHLCTASFPS